MLIFLTGLVEIKLSPPYSRKLINARQSQELLFGMTPVKGDQKTLVIFGHIREDVVDESGPRRLQYFKFYR